MNIYRNVWTPERVCPFNPEQRCEARSWGQVEKSSSQQRGPPGEHRGSPWLTWLPLASGCTWSHAGRGSGPGHRSPASPHTTRLLTWQTALVQRGRLAVFRQQAVPWALQCGPACDWGGKSQDRSRGSKMLVLLVRSFKIWDNTSIAICDEYTVGFRQRKSDCFSCLLLY